jgi:hypothetical protein
MPQPVNNLEPVVHGRVTGGSVFTDRLQVLLPRGGLKAARKAARARGYKRKRDLARYIRSLLHRDMEEAGLTWPAPAEPEEVTA